LLFLEHPPTTELSTLSLHDALPICAFSAIFFSIAATVKTDTSIRRSFGRNMCGAATIGSSMTPVAMKQASRCFMAEVWWRRFKRSEEHTSELQSRFDLVCRLLLEKK